MSIQDIPDELLYQMCEGWDNRTLLNMAESYSRVYQVCSDIISKKAEDARLKRIQSIINLNKQKFRNVYGSMTGWLSIRGASYGWSIYPGRIFLPDYRIAGSFNYLVKTLLDYGHTLDEAHQIINTRGITKDNYRTTMKDLYESEVKIS